MAQRPDCLSRGRISYPVGPVPRVNDPRRADQSTLKHLISSPHLHCFAGKEQSQLHQAAGMDCMGCMIHPALSPLMTNPFIHPSSVVACKSSSCTWKALLARLAARLKLKLLDRIAGEADDRIAFRSGWLTVDFDQER